MLFGIKIYKIYLIYKLISTKNQKTLSADCSFVGVKKYYVLYIFMVFLRVFLSFRHRILHSIPVLELGDVLFSRSKLIFPLRFYFLGVKEVFPWSFVRLGLSRVS